MTQEERAEERKLGDKKSRDISEKGEQERGIFNVTLTNGGER